MRARVRAESWPIAGGFRIARGARTHAEVVVLEVEHDGHIGRAECVPYARYGESIDSVTEAIEAFVRGRNLPPKQDEVANALGPGAVRNAIDCALWDLQAKRRGAPVWKLMGRPDPPERVLTMRTISVDTPERMAESARSLAHAETLKVKVDGGEDLERIAAVRETAPATVLVVDANESWSEAQLTDWLPRLLPLGVSMLEQPLPAGGDAPLAGLRGIVPFCADESFHDRTSLDEINGRYDVVNVKLDKAGGLTEAHLAQREAHALGLRSMIGCMVSTSLAVAPARLLAAEATYVDLDGPLLLERDREGAANDETLSLLGDSHALWGT